MISARAILPRLPPHLQLPPPPPTQVVHVRRRAQCASSALCDWTARVQADARRAQAKAWMHMTCMNDITCIIRMRIAIQPPLRTRIRCESLPAGIHAGVD
eukprot:2807401-Pyramimonas_sp.AAC.1